MFGGTFRPFRSSDYQNVEARMMNRMKYLVLLMLIVVGISSVNAQSAESDAVITLERTACFGTCPVYTITILEDGTVLYNGERFVTVTGEQTSEIAPETVAAMVAAFEDAGYFGWDEAYQTQTVSDLPTVITSVTRDGVTHRIERYMGDYTAPLALPFLEQWIDEMTNSALWTGVQPDISAISNGADTPLITLQRGPNFGSGSVYNLAAFEDGTVVYTGIANVNELGVHVFETEAAAITGIAQTAQILGYFGWQDSYEQRIMTDQATVITSIRWEDQFKRIVRYDGDPNAPIGIVRIEASIDRLVADLVG
jgi:hypothetical protein